MNFGLVVMAIFFGIPVLIIAIGMAIAGFVE